MNKKKERLSAVDLRNRWINILLLLASLTSIGILILELAYKKLSSTQVSGLDVVFAILWLLMGAETVIRVIRLKSKEERIDYLKFNKAEILYFIVSLIVVPTSFFVVPMRTVRWIIIFKLPNILRRFRDENVFQVIANLVSIILIAFFIVPFINVISSAISAPGQIINILPKKIDLFAIQYVLKDTAFLKSFGNSIFIAVVGTTISILCMAMAAYPLSKPQMPLRKTMLMFFMILMLFSGGIAPNILLVNALGLTDTIWSMIFPSVVAVYYLLLLKGFYESIPEELEESAKLDGASNYLILFKIVIPMAAPMIATVSFFTLISYWNNINNAILYVTSNQSIYPVPMYIKNFLSRDPMDVAQSAPELLGYWDNIRMSYILFSIVPVACVYPFIFKFIKGDISAGAVKG